MSDPLFPFGFGLSYTSFYIGNAKLNNLMIKPDESIELTIPVSNIGTHDGTEVVQVYVRKINDSSGPLKTLKGFQRINLAAGKTDQVVIRLPYKSFEFYDRSMNKMIISPGDYEVLYGNSSDAKNLKSTIITIQ